MEAALASLPLSTLQTYLSEAIQAKHRLATGKSVVQVQNAGQSRTFQEVKELDTYISDLNAAISAKQAQADPSAPRRGPIHFGFGGRY